MQLWSITKFDVLRRIPPHRDVWYFDRQRVKSEQHDVSLLRSLFDMTFADSYTPMSLRFHDIQPLCFRIAHHKHDALQSCFVCSTKYLWRQSTLIITPPSRGSCLSVSLSQTHHNFTYFTAQKQNVVGMEWA
jgi:hypothetical protein